METLNGPEKLGSAFTISGATEKDAGKYKCFFDQNDGLFTKFILKETGKLLIRYLERTCKVKIDKLRGHP